MKYLALGLQIVGVICLYWAAIEMSWGIRTYKGESLEEKAFRKKQRVMGITGLALLFIGMVIPYF